MKLTVLLVVSAAACAALLSWLLSRPISKYLLERGIVDIPGVRSSHARPTPRGAGMAPLVAIAVVLAVVAALGFELPSFWFFLASGLMALVALADDMFGEVSPAVRLALQCAIATGYVLLAGGLQTLPVPGLTNVNLGIVALPLTVLWLVAVPNIYNFLDGIDGFAASQAVICGLAIAVLGGGGGLSVLGGVIAGAALGFLPHNWQPAKMFMGDVGSVTFGFMFAAVPFELGSANTSAMLLAISLCLWFFLADGAYTIVRRLFTGEKIWQAHRTHLYQRLVRTGLSHADVTIGVMLAQSVIASFAVASFVLYPGDARLLGLSFAVSLLLFEAYRGLTRRMEGRLREVSPTSGTPRLAHEDSAEFAAVRRHLSVSQDAFGPWPYFSGDEIDAVRTVLESGGVNYFTGNNGSLFEQEFAQFVGTKYAVAVMNGTVALEAALRALGIGPGDEVIVPSRTFVATASSVELVGARPIFADVDRESGNLTAETIEAVLSPKARAIVVVHLAGWPCDMDSINELARQHDLKVIEDCAQALGATYKGQPIGSLGDIAAFSFCQDKIMTTGGEGGMVTTNDRRLWSSMWSFKDHGKNIDALREARDSPPGFVWLVESFGTNGRMTEMQAAVGRVALPKVAGWVESRNRNAAYLADRFRDIPGLRLVAPPNSAFHAYYKYYAFVEPAALGDGWDRDRILAEIKERLVPCFSGICSEIYLEKAFVDKGHSPARRLPVARELGETSLMFQVHPTLSDENLAAVCDAVELVMSLAVRQPVLT